MAKRRNLQVLLSLTVLNLAIYWPVTGFEFVFDDERYIVENLTLHGGLTAETLKWAFTTQYFANWHPLTWISYLIDVEIYGLAPGGWHATNLIFHIVNTALLFLVLRKMTGAVWRSALVAALFASHPLHVESVAWVSQRKDVLSTMFWLLTMGAYAFYVRGPSAGRYLAVLCLFAAGLMAKPMLVTLPFTLLLLDYWPLGRLADGKKAMASLKEKIPLFALAALSSFVTYSAQARGLAVAPIETWPLATRLSNAVVSCGKYVLKTFVPQGLACFYPHPGHTTTAWQIVASASLLVLISGAAVALRKRAPFLPAGWFWFLGTLVPVLGLVQVGSQGMADRYTYVPHIGLFIALSWGLALLVRALQRGREIATAAGLLAVAALAALSAVQVRHWRDGPSLYGHALAVTKRNWMMDFNLGVQYFRRGDWARASESFERVIALQPLLPEPYDNLGRAYGSLGKWDRALALYGRQLRVMPDSAKANHGMGLALLNLGRPGEAAGFLRRSVELDPADARALMDLGAAYVSLGRLVDALGAYRKAVAIDGNNERAHGNMGVVYERLGRPEEALRSYREVVRLRPSDSLAYYNMGVALTGLGRLDEAAAAYERAAALDPLDPLARLNLGIVYLKAGRKDEALRQHEILRSLDPVSAQRLHDQLKAAGAKR